MCHRKPGRRLFRFADCMTESPPPPSLCLHTFRNKKICGSALKNCPNALPAHLVAYDDLETRP